MMNPEWNILRTPPLSLFASCLLRTGDSVRPAPPARRMLGRGGVESPHHQDSRPHLSPTRPAAVDQTRPEATKPPQNPREYSSEVGPFVSAEQLFHPPLLFFSGQIPSRSPCRLTTKNCLHIRPFRTPFPYGYPIQVHAGGHRFPSGLLSFRSAASAFTGYLCLGFHTPLLSLPRW